MALRKLKPTTPGQRGASVSDFAEITRSTPEKSLVRPIHSKGGRNNQGRITVRHQGGGHKRAYRLIDFVRNDKDGVPAKVAHIEYDPNRTARIALLHYADGENERLKRILEADNTKPAIEAVTVAINTMEAVYQSELITQVNITPSSKNWRFFHALR